MGYVSLKNKLIHKYLHTTFSKILFPRVARTLRTATLRTPPSDRIRNSAARHSKFKPSYSPTYIAILLNTCNLAIQIPCPQNLCNIKTL